MELALCGAMEAQLRERDVYYQGGRSPKKIVIVIKLEKLREVKATTRGECDSRAHAPWGEGRSGRG
jgi:hypothetical protein